MHMCIEPDQSEPNQDPFAGNRDAFVQFLTRQKEEIERHRWIESEKAGHDLGNKCVSDWVNVYSKKFREWYCRDILNQR